MSASGRGPTGAASLPPDWLKSVHLPLKELAKESSLVRIHASNRDPIFFSPGFGHTPVGRFDSAGGHFGVLYLAASFEGLSSKRCCAIRGGDLSVWRRSAIARSRFSGFLAPFGWFRWMGPRCNPWELITGSRPAPTSRAGFGPTLCLRIRTAQMASSTRPGTIRIRRASPCFGVLISQSRSRARAFRCSKCCPKSPRCYGGTGRVSPETRAVLG